MKGITVGSDGNIWFTNWGASGDFIGMMTPTGNLTEFPLPSGTDPAESPAAPTATSGSRHTARTRST